LVFRSGCTASQIFFFCTLSGARRGGKQERARRLCQTGAAVGALAVTCVCSCALVLRVRPGLRAVAEAHALADLGVRRRRQLARRKEPRSSCRGECGWQVRVKRAKRRLRRTSSTFSCAASEAARSMPKDLTPRMLRAFRLHSTTTRRPCRGGTQMRCAGVSERAPDARQQTRARAQTQRAPAAPPPARSPRGRSRSARSVTAGMGYPRMLVSAPSSATTDKVAARASCCASCARLARLRLPHVNLLHEQLLRLGVLPRLRASKQRGAGETAGVDVTAALLDTPPSSSAPC
jgi:hypothetical protein